MCAAFSRAKLGFYIIGNLNCIVKGEFVANKNKRKKSTDLIDKVWTNIQTLAEQKEIISPSITLFY